MILDNACLTFLNERRNPVYQSDDSNLSKLFHSHLKNDDKHGRMEKTDGAPKSMIHHQKGTHHDDHKEKRNAVPLYQTDSRSPVDDGLCNGNGSAQTNGSEF